MNYFSNDLEILLTIVVINIVFILIYHLIFNKGKFYFNILRMKVNIQNKDTWSEESTNINKNTKSVDLDFKLQLYNHKKYYSSIYNIIVKHKKENITNPYLNLIDTKKSVLGSYNFEKLKYATLLPFEIREFNIKIKLTKEEYENIKKEPIYIYYIVGRKKKKINLNKYLKLKKKEKSTK